MRHGHNNNAYSLSPHEGAHGQVEREGAAVFNPIHRHQETPGFQAAGPQQSLLSLVTEGLVIWRTGCHVLIVRSSGQTGFSNAQGFFWQTENINSFLMSWLAGSSFPGPRLSCVHILPPPTRDCSSEVLLGKRKSHY